MNLSKIKMVVADMDGTLLNSQGNVSSSFFSQFEQLQKLGITFVAASGRQYYSIVHKLEPIKNDIYVIAENGALTMHKEKELQATEIDRNTYLELLKKTKTLPDSQVILCARNNAYIENYGSEFEDLMSEFYYRYKVVDQLEDVTDDRYLKIAICNQKGSEEHLYPELKYLEDRLKVKVSGEIWLDLSHLNANKGNALSKLQQQLQIRPEETLVFGDYNNDLEMLAKADFSFAMQNAHPNVIKAANYQTKSNDEDGVGYILEQLIENRTSR